MRIDDEVGTWRWLFAAEGIGEGRGRSASGEGLSGGVGEMLDDRPERQRREEGEAADDQDHADEQADEQRPVVGNVPAEAGTVFLAASEPAIASAGTMTKKRPTSMPTPSVTL